MAFTPEQFFGKIGVKNGVFTKEQLDECFRVQRDRYRETGEKEPLSYILQEKKLISREQMRDLLQEFKYSCMRKDDKELAQIAVEKNFLSEEEIELALNFQRKLFRNGVGLFQLGEILISREILKDSEVFELSCQLWLRRHPGQTLPKRIARKKDQPDETAIISTSEKEVAAIQKSIEGKGFKLCKECGYQNPMIVEICYGCGEPLIEYTVITASNNVKYEAQEIDVTEGILCPKCGHNNPDDAIICFHCFEDLIAEIFDKDLEKIEDSEAQLNENEETLPDRDKPTESEQTEKEVTEDVLSKVNALMAEITQDLKPDKHKQPEKIESKQPTIKVSEPSKLLQKKTSKEQIHKSPFELLGDSPFKPSSSDKTKDDSPVLGGKVVLSPGTKVLIKAAKFDEATMKKCSSCGYVNPKVSPFCFGCYNKFE